MIWRFANWEELRKDVDQLIDRAKHDIKHAEANTAKASVTSQKRSLAYANGQFASLSMVKEMLEAFDKQHMQPVQASVIEGGPGLLVGQSVHVAQDAALPDLPPGNIERGPAALPCELHFIALANGDYRLVKSTNMLVVKSGAHFTINDLTKWLRDGIHVSISEPNKS
jgi:hypothetical protein